MEAALQIPALSVANATPKAKAVVYSQRRHRQRRARGATSGSDRRAGRVLGLSPRDPHAFDVRSLTQS